LNLRIGGASYREIARQLNYKDHSGAFRAVEAGLKKEFHEPAEKVRRMEIARLDAQLLRLTVRASQGDLEAERILLGNLKRRSELLGLDAPAKLEHSGELGIKGDMRVEHDYGQVKELLKDADFRALAGRLLARIRSPQS
jgi:hypothetical protein